MRTKLLLIIIVIILIAIAGTYYPSKDDGTTRYSNRTYSLSFTYPSGYVIDERDVQASGTDAYHQITLIKANDLPVPTNGEGPQAITIGIYKNAANKYSTADWIRNSAYSNFKLSNGTIATTTVSGLPALSYRWSGLYEGTTVALAQSEWIYVFSVTYLEMGAPIVQDFVKVRESVRVAP